MNSDGGHTPHFGIRLALSIEGYCTQENFAAFTLHYFPYTVSQLNLL